MKLVLASNNKKKLREMSDILGKEGFEVVSMGQMGFDSDPDENGETFEQNAFIKASAAVKICNLPCIADDSGLEVKALGGRPGVHSARYCEGTDLDRTLHLLEEMKDKEDREARFVSVVTCVFPDGSSVSARGECKGEITREIRGDGGFGYDPVFYVPEKGLTYAEMDEEKKNGLSHRGKAISLFANLMKMRIDKGNDNADK